MFKMRGKDKGKDKALICNKIIVLNGYLHGGQGEISVKHPPVWNGRS